MNYVNNWLRAIDLEQGATSCPLDLPDGEYRLTLADAAAGATRWEIVDAVVASGSATLTRAREDTADQDWPTGSVIYCGLTAGVLEDLPGTIYGEGDPRWVVFAPAGSHFVDELSGSIYLSAYETGAWARLLLDFSSVVPGSPSSLALNPEEMTLLIGSATTLTVNLSGFGPFYSNKAFTGSGADRSFDTSGPARVSVSRIGQTWIVMIDELTLIEPIV